VQGVYQLGQALSDFSADRVIRAVDENGEIKRLEDGSGERPVSDVYLRDEFPPPGKVRARRPGKTPSEVLQNLLGQFSELMDEIQTVHGQIGSVLSDDGRPLVDAVGVDVRLCREWRGVLSGIGDDLHVWGRMFARTMGTPRAVVTDDATDSDGDEVHSEEFDASYEGWDDPKENPSEISAS
jgi:hypothetical protein